MTDSYAPASFLRKQVNGRTREREAYLRENKDISSAILADAMGVHERFVLAYKAALGLTKPEPKACGYCQKIFKPRRETTKYCSSTCASRSNPSRAAKKHDDPNPEVR